jgi:hypothetical protein
MINLTKKAIELLDAVTSVPYSKKGWGYTIGRGLDAVLPFTCYSYWFSCYFDQRKIYESPYTRNNRSDTNEMDYLRERVCAHCYGCVLFFQET